MIQGQGQAHGAITVVNAIPTGKGSAIGIELTTRATVALERTPGPVEVTIQGGQHEDPTLAQACLSVVAQHAGTPLSGTITTESDIPIAQGLKSSSVAANAIVLACLDALDEHPHWETVLDLSVAAARDAGVTITGALDDAAASLLGGLVLTDNRQDVVLERKPIQTDHVVLLLVPQHRRYTQEVGPALAPMEDLSRLAYESAEAGAWQEALTFNGMGVAACLGEDLAPTYRALARGAIACGTTGTGPAVAAICHRDHAHAIRQAWEGAGHTVLATRLTNEGLAHEGAAR
ncbi:MAG: shikimate kinase [Candidatus Thermoplasmatota archaeon]|nr:shikimate kinase [Candidatus Thermoplasmatota archaeon]